MKSIILGFCTFFLINSINLFSQNEQIITVCQNSKVFFDDLLDAPINENSNKACTATIRTIKPGYGVEERGNSYFIFRDVNQTYTIISKRVPSSDTDVCDVGEGVEQTVKVVVEDCKVVSTQASGSEAFNFFAGTYRFVTRYVNQTYCEGQELSRYFVDEDGDGELDNTHIYVTLPEKNVLFGKTGLLICEDFEKDGSCLSSFSRVEKDKEYVWICDGCTDPTACNYKAVALQDDGSCFYKDSACDICSPDFGCTNASARNYNPQANCDDGTCILDPSVDQIFIDYPALNKFTDYNSCANEQITVFKNQFGTLYFEVETDLHQLIYNEKGDFECRSNTVEGFPCYSVNISKAQILDTWTCPNQPAITGCTDATACNYNAKAIADDSSCFFSSANNNCFGTCYPEAFDAQFGCTDVSATNYSPISGCDDGSCIYEGESSIFTRYPFLTDYVDENNCEGEKITLYFDNTSRNKIYVETAEASYIFDTNARKRCAPKEDDPENCTPDILRLVETWACGGVTTFEETIHDILITKPAFDSYYTFLFRYGAGLPRGDSFTVFAPTQEAFKKIYGDDLVKLTIGVAFNPVRSFFETINNHVVKGTYLSTDLYDGQVLTSITGRALVVSINEDGIFINDLKIYEADFETSNGVVHMLNDLLVAEPILLEYPWLETAVDFFRCTNEKLTIYQNGETQYIYVKEEGNGTLYTSFGQSFCTDESGFSCLDAYGLSNMVDSWTCPNYVEPETPETPTVESLIFETYNWLSDEVNATNCSNEKVTVYQSGPYDYVYIENANGGSLYTNFGLSFCTSTPGFSCVDAYRLSSITDSWTCGDEGDLTPPTPPVVGELPQELEALEWLNNTIDFNDCAGSSIEVYDFGSYSFVFVTDNGATNMYLNDGTFYCADCKSLYGISRAADEVWSCAGASKINNSQSSNTSRKTLPDNLDYQIFPNPTQGFVYLEVSNHSAPIKQVNFYDMMGKEILSRIIKDDAPNPLGFNLNNQPKGLYMVEIISENKRQMEKLLIE